jgi:carbon monoxide dehydrogenase subunit G
MVKRNGETVEYQVTLNIPHLRKKINKTCANRPVSCVNDKKPMKNAGFCFSAQGMVY